MDFKSVHFDFRVYNVAFLHDMGDWKCRNGYFYIKKWTSKVSISSVGW